MTCRRGKIRIFGTQSFRVVFQCLIHGEVFINNQKNMIQIQNPKSYSTDWGRNVYNFNGKIDKKIDWYVLNINTYALFLVPQISMNNSMPLCCILYFDFLIDLCTSIALWHQTTYLKLVKSILCYARSTCVLRQHTWKNWAPSRVE